jgi:hypothetical protein
MFTTLAYVDYSCGRSKSGGAGLALQSRSASPTARHTDPRSLPDAQSPAATAHDHSFLRLSLERFS